MKTTMQRYGRLLGLSLLAISLGAAKALAGDVTADNITVNHDLKVIDPGTGSQPTDGLLLYYSFSTSATLVPDDSGNSHTGTVYGATWTTNGLAGAGYSFDGNDYITFDYANAIPAGAVSVWVMDQGTGNNGRILGKTQPSVSDVFILGKYQTTQNLRLTVGDDSLSSSAAPIPSGEWVHYVITWDGTNVSVYQNGVYKDGKASATGVPANVLLWNIGRHNNGGETWVGLIDELRIYSRALSSNEVHGLYLYDLDLTAGSSTFETGVTCKKDVICEDGVKYLKPLGDIPMGVYTNDP